MLERDIHKKDVGYVVYLVILEKHVKVDNLCEDYCFKLRFLFHIFMLCFYFYPFILYSFSYLYVMFLFLSFYSIFFNIFFIGTRHNTN
jgi:TRAP-type mannitol/chloroaromatic compound transport system permease small subunit